MIRLLFVARPIPHKGLEDLLLALEKHIALPFQLSIVGGAECLDDINPKFKDSCMTGKVIFLGRLSQDEVANTMQRHDLLVVPSRFENFCNTALEALACGLPVLGVSLGGLSDMIEHGQNGFLIKPRNIKSLEKQLEIIIRDPSIIEKMPTQARKTAENYSWDVITGLTNDLFRSLLVLRRQGEP